MAFDLGFPLVYRFGLLVKIFLNFDSSNFATLSYLLTAPVFMAGGLWRKPIQPVTY